MQKSYQHIVVTGASSGIGEALALHYAAEGMTLSLSGRDEARLSAVAERCRDLGAAVETAALDVTDREGMERWLNGRDAALPVGLVIANAGISGGTGGDGAATGESDAQVRRIFDVNVNGVFNTIGPLISKMQKRGSGQIAIVSSVAGLRGWPGAPAYCASKAAVKVYGEALRGALADSGVQVSVICPGFVRSRMTDANDFAMPFMMEAPAAARLIANRLARGRGLIVFPFMAAFVSWVLPLLPYRFVDMLLTKMPKKRAL